MAEVSFNLGEKSEAAWRELKRHIESTEGFWVVFLFSPSAISADTLRQRVEAFLEEKNTEPKSSSDLLKTHTPDTPDVLANLLATLLADRDEDASPPPVWIQALKTDTPHQTNDSKPWRKAWETFLLRANERREVLRARFTNGLVMVAPDELKPLFREAAPDLWSVRTMVLELDEPVFSPSAVDAQLIETKKPRIDTDTDPEIALQEAARLERQRPDAHLALAQAYTRAAEGFLAKNADLEARTNADKALSHLQTVSLKATSRRPESFSEGASTYLRLSNIFNQLGQWESALLSSKEAVEI
jgi:hypothetical protein